MDFETFDKITSLMSMYFRNARDTLELISIITTDPDVRVHNSMSLVINQIDQGVHAIEEYMLRRHKEAEHAKQEEVGSNHRSC